MTNERDDDATGALDRELLDAYEAPEPAADLADRVLAALGGPARQEVPVPLPPGAPVAGTPPAGPRRRAPWRVVALIVPVAAAAAALFFALRPSGSRVAATGGHLDATGRQALTLGGRGVVVAEAGAALVWHVGSDGAARVEQRAGDVFYRIEPGGPFVVSTPAGRVTVTGTCFRLEVVPMKVDRRTVISTAAGAALSATIIVSVYEGRVLFANEHGSTEISAGERAVARQDQAPLLVDTRRPTLTLEAAPAADVSREDLLRRDVAQRQELAALRARLERQERDLAAERARHGDPRAADAESPFVDTSQEELASMAAECRIAYDLPSLQREIDARLLERLDPGQRERAAEAHRRFVDAAVAELRALYIEVTGDAAGAESLSVHSLKSEIVEKSTEADAQLTLQKISRERAGLQRPPADLAAAPPIERFYRLMARLGGAYEQAVSEVIGSARAADLRRIDGGWGSKSVVSHGCPEP